MKTRLCLIAILLFTSACSLLPAGSPAPSQKISPTASPVNDLPPAETAARAYLDAWKAEDYPLMYGMLTAISQSAISQEEFTRHYLGVAKEAALKEVDYQILSSLVRPEQAQVGYRVFMDSSLVGKFQSDTLMNLSYEDGQWRVQWDDTLVLPQLKGGNYLAMDRQGFRPARANIYDRNGQALVAQVDATAIGLYPDQVDPAQAEALYAQLAELTGMRVDAIKALHANFPPGAGWYLPLGEVPADVVASRFDELAGYRGLVLEPYKARYYFGAASHLLGYMSEIPAERLADNQRDGYQAGERVGLSGIEEWAEPNLAGQRGGALYVRNPQGLPVTRLAAAEPQAGQAVYTTIDKDFQEGVQQAIAGFRGAVVVLERDTGRVLALVSSPDFNPNAFEPVNYNSQALQASLESPDQPLFNRATLGQYPLGSVFKIITMAAAIESGLYTPESTYYCGHTFDELQGLTLFDWTYEYDFQPSGLLTLEGGLIRSCNPWFYHIGLDLFNSGLKTAIAEMARAFGLGSLTGIAGVAEAPGQVPDPENEIDATNQSIGQGALLVTPLQVASFIAAIGNGGTLYRPQVIEKIAAPGEEPVLTFHTEAAGKLPLQPETLQAIQQALVGVVQGTNPRGTAQHVFTGLDIPVAGKTGTAQTGISAPHAWFAGYTDAQQSDRPDIAIAVVVENIGEGSDYAAPIFRRIVELYFRGLPGKLYDWEATYNVTSTPPPDALVVPTPAP